MTKRLLTFFSNYCNIITDTEKKQKMGTELEESDATVAYRDRNILLSGFDSRLFNSAE